jgi:hypothetical protein
MAETGPKKNQTLWNGEELGQLFAWYQEAAWPHVKASFLRSAAERKFGSIHKGYPGTISGFDLVDDEEMGKLERQRHAARAIVAEVLGLSEERTVDSLKIVFQDTQSIREEQEALAKIREEHGRRPVEPDYGVPNRAGLPEREFYEGITALVALTGESLEIYWAEPGQSPKTLIQPGTTVDDLLISAA